MRPQRLIAGMLVGALSSWVLPAAGHAQRPPSGRSTSASVSPEPDLLKPVVTKLGSRATLHFLEAADHSFHVPVRSGRKDTEVMTEALDAFAAWIAAMRI